MMIHISDCHIKESFIDDFGVDESMNGIEFLHVVTFFCKKLR